MYISCTVDSYKFQNYHAEMTVNWIKFNFQNASGQASQVLKENPGSNFITEWSLYKPYCEDLSFYLEISTGYNNG